MVAPNKRVDLTGALVFKGSHLFVTWTYLGSLDPRRGWMRGEELRAVGHRQNSFPQRLPKPWDRVSMPEPGGSEVATANGQGTTSVE
jgi:hypothetical protein